jgi:[protein-PII] uridylyltransferase
MSDFKALREEFRAKKAELFQSLAEGNRSARGVGSTLGKLARLADQTLVSLWQRAAFPPSLALAAVGGYGRGELFPHSDVDVLVLLPDDIVLEHDADLKTRLEGFIGSCWDTGLEIGSSVRSVADCLNEARQDVTVQTSLLESRLITGNAAVYEQFRQQFVAAIDPHAFFVAKTLELHQRHSKFDNTPYSLEPNCKESPGGLRDLQVILWVAKAAGLGGNWNELAQNGLATAFEVQQIKRNEALLWLIRTRLHLIAKRREDRLIFDMQTAVAQAFGFEPAPATADKRTLVRPSEALMKRYYWAAKAVTQLSQILLLNIEERLSPSTHEPRPINARFSDKAGMLEVASDDLYRRQPHAIMETFLVFQSAGMNGLSARTLRALYNARELMNGAFRQDPVNRATFMQILQQRSGITHALRLMNQTSVLGRYLWAFRKIVGQMQHDLFHVYTVDQHVLMVLRNVRRYFIVEHAHEYPFCSQLASGWDRPWVLYVAALFHDIAKGRGGDHSQLGEIEARRFCKQHGVSRDNTDLIAFIVREHLTMSRVAQKTDLSDPDVIAAFAKRVGNERYLTALYLFTVADIRGTSPKVWNAWKGKLLEDLYHLTLRVLGGHTADPHVEVETRKREALIQLALHAQPFEGHKALWDTMDVGYFMRHDAADIAWHTRQLSRHVNSGKSIVRARLSPLGEGLQVLVYTPDQADLFARICGYFEQRGFSILDARVHTANNRYALDTFQVTAQAMPELYHELASMVEAELVRAIVQTGPLPAPGKGRVSRRVKSFPIAPRVSLQPDEKGQRWLLNISASDRVGLLYSVARVLARHKVNVQLAKINTLGERVDDTFLIDGPELQENKAQIAIETELLEALA